MITMVIKGKKKRKMEQIIDKVVDEEDNNNKMEEVITKQWTLRTQWKDRDKKTKYLLQKE